MQHTRGEYILMVDADGATKFSDLDALLLKLKAVERDGLGVAVGSRAHMVKTDAVVKVSFFFFLPISYFVRSIPYSIKGMLSLPI